MFNQDSPSLEYPLETLRGDDVPASEHLWRVVLCRLVLADRADEYRVIPSRVWQGNLHLAMSAVRATPTSQPK
jgi:hypothetical protein